jgi:hypothetical protein
MTEATSQVILITCQSCYGRLQRTLSSIRPLCEMLSTDPILVIRKDINNLSTDLFDARLWVSHIVPISPILCFNIYGGTAANRTQLIPMAGSIGSKDIEVLRQRTLRPQEMSLVLKHYLALKSASESPGNSLVIEDDALVHDPHKLFLLLKHRLAHERFIDLSSEYILPIRGKPFNLHYGTSLEIETRLLRTAHTRTTGAYIVTKDIAKQMINNYWPCSLPADLHHQHILSMIGAPGAWTVSPMVRNLSHGGELESAVQCVE